MLALVYLKLPKFQVISLIQLRMLTLMITKNKRLYSKSQSMTGSQWKRRPSLKIERSFLNVPTPRWNTMPKECANKCYHIWGREKKATVCGHHDKPLYAKGCCKQCYLMDYKEKICLNIQHTSHEKTNKRFKHTDSSFNFGLADMSHRNLKQPGSLSAS